MSSSKNTSPKSIKFITIGVLASLALAALAFMVGSHIKSPAQAAATAKPPPLSTITVPIQKEILKSEVTFRGNVVETNPISITPPTIGAGELPVVTGNYVKTGDKVNLGSVLLAISDQPIILMQGTIPAFRNMQYQDQGPDIAELQNNLVELGFSIGNDQTGLYGIDTAKAVKELFSSLGFQPNMSEFSIPNTSKSSGKTTKANSTSKATGAVIQNSSGQSDTLVPLATVPLGEIVFLPNLPTYVISDKTSLGEKLVGISQEGNTGLITLGSDNLSVTGQVSSLDGQSLRVGMEATLADNITNKKWPAKITKISQATSQGNSGIPEVNVSLSPSATNTLPQSELGNNLQVILTTASTSHPVFVVPIAAVYARQNGSSFITVIKHNHPINIKINVGLDVSGNVEVTPIDSTISAGEQVVVGAAH
jgi:hypothetical protein